MEMLDNSAKLLLSHQLLTMIVLFFLGYKNIFQMSSLNNDRSLLGKAVKYIVAIAHQHTKKKIYIVKRTE